MDKSIVIIGAGGHGKVVADIAQKIGYTRILFLDNDLKKKYCLNYPVVGSVKNAEDYRNCDFNVAIGNNKLRKQIQDYLLSKGLRIVTLIHPKAVIGTNVRIGLGTVIMAGAIVNPDTVVGNGCIINTGATIDHDNIIGDYVHISVGCHLAGEVKIGDCTMLGIGAVVSNNKHVCSGCLIGAGAVIVKNLDKRGTYIGVPAECIEK